MWGKHREEEGWDVMAQQEAVPLPPLPVLQVQLRAINKELKPTLWPVKRNHLGRLLSLSMKYKLHPQ